jgi:polar amino acid transport system substrate-binding protein
MWKKLSLAFVSLVFAIVLPRSASAETTIEKVARTGILTVGTRLDLVPYSYVNDQKQLVGYSIDVIDLIKEQLEEQLGKEITVQVIAEEDFAERIPRLVSKEIDISCDTVFTWERDRFVDFSVSYGISGIRLAVPKDSPLSSPESLAGQRIGVTPNTVVEQTIKLVQPQATLVPVQNLEEGFTALQEGKIDALAGDTVILAGEIARRESDALMLTPAEPYARYGIACMVAENNSSFLNAVDYALVKMMQGYVNGEPSSIEMVGRWFGPEGIVDLPPELIRGFFQSIIITREQIPLAEETPASSAGQ